MTEQLKTGTTTIAVVCKDCIILGADRRATLGGGMIVNKDTQKIYNISDNMALTMAGSVSDIQLIIKYVKSQLRLKKVRSTRELSVKEAANLLSGIVYSNIRSFSAIPALSHFLLGGQDNEGLHVYDIFPDGSVTKVNDYVSSGSGSVFAYGVLEALFKKNLSCDEGTKIVKTALNAAIQRDTASGSGFDIVKITKGKIEKVEGKPIEMKIEA